MGCATKQQLAQAIGLSVMAAGTAVEHLMEKGRVLAGGGRAAATGGRPAAEYAYNADYAHALILCAFEENGCDKSAPTHSRPDGKLHAPHSAPAGAGPAGELCAGC